MADSNVYTTGGTVQAGNGVYLARKADEELLALCREGAFSFVLTARQMGKSSLMIRTAERLAAEGIRSVILDLTQIGVQVTAEQWYLGILESLEEQLDLRSSVTEWWHQRAHLSMAQRLTNFMQEVLLKELQEPVVIFVDEIDTTLSLDFTDDFYAAIRYLHNARAARPELRRLAFVLIGVATPTDLIRDPKRTPFNLGHRVDLTDFTFEEGLPLARGMGLSDAEAQQVLRWVLKRTNGHPYLTQRLCRVIANENRGPHRPQAYTQEIVDQIVARTFFGKMSEQDANLQFVRSRLLKAVQLLDVLSTYHTILLGKRQVRDEEQSLSKSQLKLAGIVQRDGALLRVRNEIYARVFNAAWVKEHFPVNWKRRLQRFAIAAAASIVALGVWLAIIAFRDNQRATDKAKLENLLRQQQLDVATALGRAKDAELKQKDAENKRREDQQRAERRVAWLQRKFLVASLEQQRAQRLAMASSVLLEKTPDMLSRALLLAAESAKRDYTPSTDEALSKSLLSIPVRRWRVDSGQSVQALAVSPDGALLATASGGTVSLRDSATGKEVRRVDQAVSARSLTFSPDGKSLAVTLQNGAAGLWSVETGEEAAPPSRRGSFSAVAFNLDHKLLAIAHSDGAVRIWNGPAGMQVAELPRSRPVRTAAFSSDGKLLAMVGDDKTVSIWNYFPSSQMPMTLQGTAAEIAFSPTGKVLATANERSIYLHDLGSTGKANLLLNDSPVESIAFGVGNRLVATGADSAAYLWDTGRRLVTKLLHGGPVRSAGFSPDGKLVATASDDGAACLWNAGQVRRIMCMPHGAPVSSVAFSPDGKLLYTASRDGAVQAWETSPTGREVARITAGAAVSALGFDAEGAHLLVASDEQRIQAWDTHGLLQSSSFWEKSNGQAPTFSNDGKRFAIIDDAVSVWDLTAGKTIAQYPLGEVTSSISLSPDGKILSITADAQAQFFEVETHERLFSLPAWQAIGMAVSTNKLIAVTNGGKTAYVVELGGNHRRIPLPHEGTVRALAFNPSGKLLATISADQVVRLWKTAKSSQSKDQLLSKLPSNCDGRALTFSPDGKYLAIGCADTVRLWDVAKEKQVVNLHQDAAVNLLTFSPDGKLLASAGDKAVRLWQWWRPDDLIEEACRRLDRNLTQDEWIENIGEREERRQTCKELPLP